MTTPKFANIAYGPLPMQVMDVYVPATPLRAAFLMIHGGGWHAGSKSVGASYNNGIRLLGEGYVVAMMNYRLLQNYRPGVIPNPGETNTWPAALVDAQRAVCWMKKNARVALDAMVCLVSGAPLDARQ